MTWEHAFVGGGIAACSLALRLVRDNAGPILLIEPHAHDARTFAFWTDRALGIDALVSHRWSRLRIEAWSSRLDIDLGAWRYEVVQGERLRAHAWAAIEAAGGRVVQAEVEQVEDGPDRAVILAGNTRYEARWVHDSRVPAHPPGALDLQQSFTGWWVEADEDIFDPSVATLMDFAVPQEPHGIRFFHVLPVSARRALVTGVNFARDVRSVDVGAYLQERLRLRRWRITGRETGITPMSDHRFRRRLGERVLGIGIAGGRLKPSTGYAFARIQDDSEHIAASLRRQAHPFGLPRERWTWRLLDAVLLRLVQTRGPATEHIFLALFQRNPIDRVLRFLDERASLPDIARIAWTLPRWTWFFAALVQVMALRFYHLLAPAQEQSWTSMSSSASSPRPSNERPTSGPSSESRSSSTPM